MIIIGLKFLKLLVKYSFTEIIDRYKVAMDCRRILSLLVKTFHCSMFHFIRYGGISGVFFGLNFFEIRGKGGKDDITRNKVEVRYMCNKCTLLNILCR